MKRVAKDGNLLSMEHAVIECWILDVSSLPLSLAERLNAADKARFDRYLKEESKATFLGGRLLIKKAFGGIALSFQDNQKPFIERGMPFSLSHSYPYVAFVSAPFSIGVDIESKVRLEDSPVVSYFPEEDRQNYADLGELWCLKEAIYKARGEGYFDPKEALVKNEDGSFAYRGKTFYGHSFDYHGFKVVVMSGTPCRIKLKEIEIDEIR